MQKKIKKIVDRWKSDAFETKILSQKIFQDLKLNLKYSPHPISGWRSSPNQDLETVKINSHGLRNNEFKLLEDNKDTCMLLGGSVAWGFGASNNKNILSALIEKSLEEKYKIKLNVINFAEQMHSSHEELMTFVGYVDEINPKYVICLSGTNDINRGNSNFFKFSDLNNSWINFFNKGQVAKIINENNNLKYLFKSILKFNKYSQKVNESNYVFKKPHKDEIPNHLFKNKIEILNSICEQKNISVIHILQPDLILKKNKSKSEQDYIDFVDYERIEYSNKQLEIFKKNYKSLELTKKNNKIAFIDHTEIFNDINETIFFDKSHFSDKGYKILSEKIANEIKTDFF